MANTEGAIKVKLVLDATEFHADLDKVLDRLKHLAAASPTAVKPMFYMDRQKGA